MTTALLAAVLLSLSAPQDPLQQSLPRTEGAVTVPGLAGRVVVARDDRGIPVITRATLDDVHRGAGFVHAQERFFQMDAARRYAAGELSEVLGPDTLRQDRLMRRYRFRAVAREVVARLPETQRRALEAYAEGVNAGLDDLGVAPVEYAVLRFRPRRWTPEDSILVMMSMYDALHVNARYERRAAVMEAALPPELFDFLTPGTTRFDAPLLDDRGAPARGENDHVPAPVPGPEVVDLRTAARPAGGTAPTHAHVERGPMPAVGSNNWAVAGSRSRHRGAMIANDPHLQISIPIIWFRQELVWGDDSVSHPDLDPTAAGHARGAALPGVPGIVIGATDHLAWGFTNTTADFQDLVLLETDAGRVEKYRTPDGWEAFDDIVETILVRGAEPDELTVRQTRWGPVIDEDFDGRLRALRWTALDPAMTNLGLLDLMTARNLEDGVAAASGWHGPSQNAMLADANGRIAWVVTGYLPQRIGFTGEVPVSWADGTTGWFGPMREQDRPKLIDPPDGVLYTANNRTIGARTAEGFANFWASGVRAQRIAELLTMAPEFTERDLLAMQLDTRTAMYDLYCDLVLDLTANTRDERLADARQHVAAWNGTADADQGALALLDAYADRLAVRLLGPLTEPCLDLDPDFRYRWWMQEEPLRRILEERPAHLLPPEATGWPELLLEVLEEVVDELTAEGRELPDAWGDLNQTAIAHPLAAVAPALGNVLQMPPVPQPGHVFAVRVATPSFGASLRLVASPGRAQEAILHVPVGQSGHPLSPHYRDGHAAWVTGAPTPLAAGPPVSTFTLEPAEPANETTEPAPDQATDGG